MKFPIIFIDKKKVEMVMTLLALTSPLGWGMLIGHWLKKERL